MSLTWKAPEGCPTESDVRAEVFRLLAGPPISPGRNVVAMARVSRLEGGRWRVEVSVSSTMAQGRRSLEAETCSGLADATALIVAITVDPDRAGAAASAPATSPSPQPVASRDPLAAAPSRPAPVALSASRVRAERAPSAATDLRWSMDTWGLVDFGTLPATAYGGAFGVAAIAGHLRSEAGFSVVPGRTYPVASQSGVGADMSLWFASANLAYRVPLGAAELALGGGAEVAHLSAVGVEVTAPIVGVPGSATWTALRADATLTAPIFVPLLLRLEVDAVAPLRRPTFVIDPLGGVHQPSALTGRFGVGVELRF